MGVVALRLAVSYEECLTVEVHVQDQGAFLHTDHYKLFTLPHAAEVQGVNLWMGVLDWTCCFGPSAFNSSTCSLKELMYSLFNLSISFELLHWDLMFPNEEFHVLDKGDVLRTVWEAEPDQLQPHVVWDSFLSYLKGISIVFYGMKRLFWNKLIIWSQSKVQSSKLSVVRGLVCRFVCLLKFYAGVPPSPTARGLLFTFQ